MQAALCFDKAPTPLHDHSLSTEDLCMYLNLSDSLQELCTHNPDKFKTFGNCRGLFFQNTIIPVPFKCLQKSLPWLLSTAWIPSYNTLELDSVYSTNTRRSLSAVFPTRRNYNKKDTSMLNIQMSKWGKFIKQLQCYICVGIYGYKEIILVLSSELIT